MIGWLNEINRLASKGKREHREPPWEPPETALKGSPARPSTPRPVSWSHPGALSCPQPKLGRQDFRKKLETHREILSDLRFGREGPLLESGREGEARLGQASCCSPGAPLLHNSTLSPPPPPQQPRDGGWEEPRQAPGALTAMITEQLQISPTPCPRLPDQAWQGLRMEQGMSVSVYACVSTCICVYLCVCARAHTQPRPWQEASSALGKVAC